jgi:hypothetical protein
MPVKKVHLGPENNPGKAHWCGEHDRLECVKNKTRGRGRCHAAAVRGTDACTTHCGFTRDIAKARGSAKITAWSSVGDATDTVDYRMAVLGVLQMTWLRLAAYSDLLRRQVVSEGMATEPELFDPEGTVESTGLIGYKYGAAGKDGNIYAQSEEVRALVALESQERDRVVRYAKTAHDMGISDRLTGLAERWGDVVATRITLMLDALDLTPEQSIKVPALIQAHLGSIDVDAMGTQAQAIGTARK